MPANTLVPSSLEASVSADRRDYSGNVDPSTGNVDFAGNIGVVGDVVDQMRVRCEGSLRVGGVIQAADVQVGRNLVSAGGISGRDKGRCLAGGDVKTHYLQRARVEAGGDVEVATETRASWIVCGGKFISRDGQLLGGSLIAAGGVTCRNIGSVTGIATIVGAGNGPAIGDLAQNASAELDVYREKARRAAALGNRLLKDQKRMTPREKERATELLFKSYELVAEIQKIAAMIRARHEEVVATAVAEIRVAEVLHAGVIVRFLGMEARIESGQRGPLKLTPRRGNTRCIVLTDDAGGTLVLPTRLSTPQSAGNVSK